MEQEQIYELDDGRVFVDYGPVSMVITAARGGKNDPALAKTAFPVIREALSEMGRAQDQLRRYPASVEREKLTGCARIMADAVLVTGDPLLTPMAAVAGTMADTVADFLFAEGAEKVIVNNGGDIALRLGEGQSVTLGIRRSWEGTLRDEPVRLTGESGVGGVATSGLGGRSLTTGIADSVTVLAARCAAADACATHLADASYIESAAVHRAKAGEIDPGSDIADLMVVTAVGPLLEEEKETSLRQVIAAAEHQQRRSGILACTATVQGRTATFDPGGLLGEQESGNE